MKKLIHLFVLAALVTTLVLPALAQTTPATGTATPTGQDTAQAKIDLYGKFTKNYKQNPALAYEAAKEYLQKFEAAATTDEDKKIVAYLKNWVASYDKLAHKAQLLQQLKENKVNEAFAASKAVLAEFPDDLGLYFELAKAGYLAADSGNEANNALAIEYAKKTTQLVQSGKSFDPNTPLTEAQKNEMLGNLNFALGVMTSKTAPGEALTYLLNAAQLEGANKKNPLTYIYLADVYEKAEYTRLKNEYTAQCKTPEQLNSQVCNDLNTKVNQVVDHIIDAMARAIAFSNLSSESAKFATARTKWTELLTTYYKYRNNGSDTGLKELIASITSRPLPKPGEPVLPAIVPQAAPTTPSSTASPTQPSGSTTGTPAGKGGTAPATTAPATTKQTSPVTPVRPAGKASTRNTPKRSHATNKRG